MRQARVDYRLRFADIAPTLARLSAESAPDERAYPVPAGLEAETRIALEDKALNVGVIELGESSLFTCPECHGVMLRSKAGGGLRFRCHTRHAYTADALLAELTESIEGVLWTAVRSVQESSLLMEHIAAHVRDTGNGALASVYERKAVDAIGQAELVRRVVMEHETLSRERFDGKNSRI